MRSTAIFALFFALGLLGSRLPPAQAGFAVYNVYAIEDVGAGTFSFAAHLGTVDYYSASPVVDVDLFDALCDDFDAQATPIGTWTEQQESAVQEALPIAASPLCP